MWVQLEQFPNYLVDETGRVASLHGSQWKELRQYEKRCGYLGVVLYDSGNRKDVLVHVLVAAAFLGPKPGGLQVNHKDGDKTNNRLSNLEYVTPSENIQHAYDNGLAVFTAEMRQAVSEANSGENNGKSKLTDAQAAQILRLKGKGRTQADVANTFNVSQRMVSKIWLGRRKNAQNS